MGLELWQVGVGWGGPWTGLRSALQVPLLQAKVPPPRIPEEKGEGWQRMRLGLEQNDEVGKSCLLPPAELPTPHSCIVTLI